MTDPIISSEVLKFELFEIFSIIPEFDEDQIFSQNFLNTCNNAYNMATCNHYK